MGKRQQFAGTGLAGADRGFTLLELYANNYLGWTGDVYIMNADGTGQTNLTDSQNTYGAAFSPDGTKLAFTRKTGTQIDLYTVPVTGGAATRLTTGRNIYGIPAWSQDGAKLTFSSNQDIYTINADGTGEANVTNNASANNTFPGFSTGTTPTVASVYYIYTDHLNTPRAITNEAATTVWKWDNVNPFGANAPNEDPDGDSQAFVFNLRFPGQYFDQETNLHYNYYRDYDPSIGRYVESDPVGLDASLNTYAYVGGNPLRYIDPLGLQGNYPGINLPVTPSGDPISFNLVPPAPNPPGTIIIPGTNVWYVPRQPQNPIDATIIEYSCKAPLRAITGWVKNPDYRSPRQGVVSSPRW